MERKIGEVFKLGGEWYQCIVGTDCKNCAFNERKCYTIVDNGDPVGECCADRRKDGKNIIFKKLEKVGEPYSDYCPSGRIICFQRYKCYQKPIYTGNFICWADDINISIEIKQNQEDMEEKKLNLKPFDLKKAKEGKPVCTRGGRNARIICFDAKGTYPIIALVPDPDIESEEIPFCYTNGGFYNVPNYESIHDLMMLPEKKEGWVLLRKDGCVFDNEEVARKNCTNDYFVAKVEWEE